MIRKGLIVQRIIKTVNEYFDAFEKPISMQVLSAKYSRSLLVLGTGFPELMDELKTEGSVQIFLTETGGKLVYPEGKAVFANPSIRAIK